MRRVVVYPDAQTLADATAARLLTSLTDALATQDTAHIVLTGGTVGIKTLASIAHSPVKEAINWSAVHVWWGDERFVPSGDADRNEGQAQSALLGSLPLPEENIHRMGSSDDFHSPESAAAAYLDLMSRHGTPQWDVLLLGLGPDGHVASLFPGHPGFTKLGANVIAVHDSPKPPPTRVSLGLGAINRAKQVWVVAAGAEKADAVKQCLGGDGQYPGSEVGGTEATLWLVDAAAISRV